MNKNVLLAIALVPAVVAAPKSKAADNFKVLFSFNAVDGQAPTGSPTLVGNVLYGLTSQGGSANDGAVFQFNLNAGTETAPHSFTGATTDGSTPYGSLSFSGANTFYGLTNMGGSKNLGTIFQFNSSSGVETPVYSFAGSPGDGQYPVGSPLLSGTFLYGTTAGGPTGGGTLFQYNTAAQTETVIHAFSGGASDGYEPYGSVIVNNNILYGMTVQGGGTNDGGGGTIFQYNLTNKTESLVHSFAGGNSDGLTSFGSLVLANGNLFGLTELGGASNKGVIFQYNLATGTQTVLHSFAGGSTDGSQPEGSLLLLNNVLYGMTFNGGTDADGVIFGYDLLNNSYSVLHQFISIPDDGSNPTWGSLIASVDTLYGVAPFRGTQDDGVIFSLAVPEPDSLSLLTAGCGLSLLRRRRGRRGVASHIPAVANRSVSTFMGGTVDL